MMYGWILKVVYKPMNSERQVGFLITMTREESERTTSLESTCTVSAWTVTTCSSADFTHQSPSQQCTKSRQDDESDICSVTDGAFRRCVDVLTKWDESADDSTQIEDHPEPGYVATFHFFRWIAHHDCALSCPQ